MKCKKFLKLLSVILCLSLIHTGIIYAKEEIANDKYIYRQWGLMNDGHNYATNSSLSYVDGIDTNVTQAWDLISSSQEVVVAIIDTGVDYTHEDLKDSIWINSDEIMDNGIDDDHNGYVDDINGWNFYDNNSVLYTHSPKEKSAANNQDNHGTHCAGIIAASSNNQVGIAGIASNVPVKIMILKVTGGNNSNATTAQVVKAIDYASKMGAKICNISLNSVDDGQTIKQAISKSNMLFISSAGNDSPKGKDIDKNKTYPASLDLPNLMSVAALNPNGSLADYSNYGKRSVSLAAPGTDIYSTGASNTYYYSSGTSMAAPFVTGTAAIIASYRPDLYPYEIRDIIESSVTPSPKLKGITRSGGYLNAGQAALMAISYSHQPDKRPPVITTTVASSKPSTTISVYATDNGESGTKALLYTSGKQNIKYFKGGTQGTSIVDNKISLKKKGTYTLYARDYDGNETIQVIKI